MSMLRVVIISLMMIALPTTPVSADVDETNSSPEVTIGFGNVTNSTMEFTMDTSVDVYIFNVVLALEDGSVYCGISGSGGLAEEHNLFVSVLYAGCWTTGYYYGAQGSYWIPSGSNDTLTTIYYQSNSPEICIGNATYVVMLPDGEFETRQADFDPNDCMTYTRYETWNDLWYVLDEDGNGEGDNESDVEEINEDSLYDFNENLSVLENFENFEEFSILMEALNITGLADDLSPSNTPQMGWTIFAPTNDAFALAGIDLDEFDTTEEIEILTEILLYHVTFAGPYALDSSTAYNSSSGEYEPHCQPYSLGWMPMLNGEYADPFDYSSWTENVTISNDCQGNLTVNQANIIDADNRVFGYEYNGIDGYPFNNELPHGWAIAEDNGMIQVIDQILIPSSLNLSQLPTSSPRFDPENDVPTALQNDGSFDILISALNITGLLDLTREENSPNMGFTMIAPTDEAFQAIGFDLDDVDTQEEIDTLTEILLHHTTIHPEGYTSAVVWFSDEYCTGADYELNVGNGEYAEPGNYSSWTETLTVSDDCEGNRTIGGANVTYFQGVSNGVIAVIDSVLIPESLSSPPPSEPRFSPRMGIPSNLENDGEFGSLLDALDMVLLLDDIAASDEAGMGMTIFAPTDEAFAEAGIDIGEFDDLGELESLAEIILNHISFDTVLSFEEDCEPVQLDLETSESFTVAISNDCEGNVTANEAAITYSQEVENGVIHVIDRLLLKSWGEPVEEPPVEEPVEEPVQGPPVEEPVEVPANDTGADDADLTATDPADGDAQASLGSSAPFSENRLAALSLLALFATVLGLLIGTAIGVRRRGEDLGAMFEEGEVAMDELMSLLSRSKMISVLNVLNSERHPIYFTELKRRVDTSSTTLSRRLSELEEHGIVERIEFATVPATVAYRLTEGGSDLIPRLEVVLEWAVLDADDTGKGTEDGF